MKWVNPTLTYHKASRRYFWLLSPDHSSQTSAHLPRPREAVNIQGHTNGIRTSWRHRTPIPTGRGLCLSHVTKLIRRCLAKTDQPPQSPGARAADTLTRMSGCVRNFRREFRMRPLVKREKAPTPLSASGQDGRPALVWDGSRLVRTEAILASFAT